MRYERSGGCKLYSASCSCFALASKPSKQANEPAPLSLGLQFLHDLPTTSWESSAVFSFRQNLSQSTDGTDASFI